MLKYSSIAAATTLTSFLLASAGSIQTASASEYSAGSRTDNSVANANKVANNPSQSDLNGIHRALNDYYGGFNEANVDRLEQGAALSRDTKKTIKEFFTITKNLRIGMFIEVTDIQLVALSNSNAVLSVKENWQLTGPNGSQNNRKSDSIKLIKDRGRWKVADMSPNELNKFKAQISNIKAMMARQSALAR
jgi:hypothetical protein